MSSLDEGEQALVGQGTFVSDLILGEKTKVVDYLSDVEDQSRRVLASFERIDRIDLHLHLLLKKLRDPCCKGLVLEVKQDSDLISWQKLSYEAIDVRSDHDRLMSLLTTDFEVPAHSHEQV